MPGMSTDRPDVLVVASIRRWVADDFQEPARAAGIPVVHSFGLDVPDLSAYRHPAWWTPTEHAARLLRAGVPLPLLATGPAWLSGVPSDLLGRDVWSGTLSDLAAAPLTRGWCKPAEAKVAKLPAAWWDATSEFASAARAAGLPETSWVQVSPTRLQLAVEYRTYVLGGQVVAVSPYLLADGTTWFPGLEDRAGLPTRDAAAFAAEAATRIGDRQPPAYVLDVGLTTAGRWVVVEGNPAWSAAAYGCAMPRVLEAVLTAADHAGLYRDWHWRPDPWLVQRSERARLLPAG